MGYDPELKIQLKLQGTVEVNYDNHVTKSAWDESTSRSKKCYSVDGGSTMHIEDPSEYDLKDVL